eukprot:GHVU01070965.1.p1 GENE.GHVU01070965.1~~GHVU01070965.1.p1  ORF type:complete len:123 (-),score=9.64 GHVU01070965.1:508-876(-)
MHFVWGWGTPTGGSFERASLQRLTQHKLWKLSSMDAPAHPKVTQITPKRPSNQPLQKRKIMLIRAGMRNQQANTSCEESEGEYSIFKRPPGFLKRASDICHSSNALASAGFKSIHSRSTTRS